LSSFPLPPSGTIAQNVTARSTHPSTHWFTCTNTFVPAPGTPYRPTYKLVMSASPSSAAGHTPIFRYLSHVPRPALNGAEPRTTVFTPGLPRQLSFSAIAPSLFVITSPRGASSGNTGRPGGTSNGASPVNARLQLIFTNNCAPVIGPFWPKRLAVRSSLAARFHAAR
jgi:hypothetical protein